MSKVEDRELSKTSVRTNGVTTDLHRVGLAMAVATLGFAGLTALSAPAPAVAVNSAAVNLAAVKSTSPNTGAFRLMWQKVENDPGKPIALSSPSVATLDADGPSMIVGDRAGYIYAYHLKDGSPVRGWPVSTGGVAVDSTASVTGTGASADIYVGVGNSANPRAGGYMKITAQGRIAWYIHPEFLPSGGGTVGVQNSLAIGNLQGPAAVVSGEMGQMEYALDANTGRTLGGFPWFEADTAFSTPALADLYGTGRPMIIEGGDSTAGLAFNKNYVNGGHLRILSPTGNAGNTANPAAGLFCSYDTNQVVQSSPAVGKTLRGGRTGITFGTGTFYAGASSTNTLFTVDDRCKLAWSANLAGSTTSSPALADNLGTGELNVIEATKDNNNAVSVYALHGSSGARIWRTDIGNAAVFGSVTTVSLNGKYQDILVPTTAGLYLLDGRTGKIISRIWQNSFMAMQSTPLVTVDPDGNVGLTIAGYKQFSGRLQGAIEHFEIVGAPATDVTAAGSWPMFHHDVHLTGNASIAAPSGVKFSADRPVSASSALDPERGAAASRVCVAGGACVNVRVQGATSTGTSNFGVYGNGYGSVVLDKTSPSAAKVKQVAVNSVLFGNAKGWVTHSYGAMRRPVAAAVSTAGAPWIGGCSTSWRVRMSYTVFYTNGTKATGTYTGPYFRGFHC